MDEFILKHKCPMGKPTAILHKATILHNGWESDNEAWVVALDSGINICMTTNHGSLQQTDISYFKEKLLETEKSVEQIKHLITLVESTMHLRPKHKEN